MFVSTQLRVHHLAKELGVTSKAIIAKCAAEGIELKNHMAMVSAGLAESIREWFSSEADITSVEESAAVDLEQVRKVARKSKPRSAKADETPEGSDSAAETAVAVAEGPATDVTELRTAEPAPERTLEVPPAAPEPEPVRAPEPAVAGPVAAPQEPEVAPPTPVPSLVPVPPPAVHPARPPATAPAKPPTEPAEPGVQRPAAQAPASPPRAPIAPAGPQVVPKPATLQGPRVVRVEAPEPTTYPRPRTGLGPAPRGVGAAPPPAAGVSPRRTKAKSRREEAEAEAARARANPRRHGGSVSEVDARLREWRDQDLIERKERLASVTGHGLRDRRAAERRRQAQPAHPQAISGRKEAITLTVPITVKDFCGAVGSPFATVSKKLMEQTGRLWMINQTLDGELAELIALELGVGVRVQKARTAYERLQDEFASRERKHLRRRPPVVAMLGHVDHGKTSLLDALRSANVAAGEAGGITQHIGAYRVSKGNWNVTFVDTPGHEAFTAMRARGANLTDVVVLVVAADDGVMPQTIEAMNHAKAAGVPIVVALNKIDLPGVDINRIYAQLSEHGLTPSEWGGTTDVIKTSAVKKIGIDDLIAHLSTLSDLLELQADATVPVMGTVVEARMREGQGVVAQVLVREGTLRPGCFVVCGPASGRVRALFDDRGQPLKEAPPGWPVAVVGLDGLPASGDQLYQVDSLAAAKDIAEEVRTQRRAAVMDTQAKPRGLEALMAGGTESEIPELNVIIKADVQGSVEVLKKTLGEFPADKARLRILHAAVGAISEADVNLAKASGAIVLGFTVVAEDRARSLADQLGVEIRLYRVIYEVLDDLHKALSGLLEPTRKEEIRATVEVRQVFNVSKVGTIAGCMVTDGTIHRSHKVRLVRDGRVVVESAGIGSLKRFKDDVREVRAGMECGIKIENYDDVKPGDVIQAYEVIEVMQTI